MMMTKNTKILTVYSYTRFGEEVYIASMNTVDLFRDEKFASTHKILYGEGMTPVTEINESEDPVVYITKDCYGYTLKKSLKGTYEAIRVKELLKEN